MASNRTRPGPGSALTLRRANAPRACRSAAAHLARAAVALACLVAAPALAEEPLRFATLTSEQGLSENTVTSIAQDRQGFLWVGTQDGLNRFDGLEFKVFRAAPDRAHGLVEDYVTALLVDRGDRLWVGTFAGGLSRYDPRTGVFENYLNVPGDERSLSHNDVSSLYEDARGRLWVGTRGGGLNRIDGDGTLARVALPADARGARAEPVSAIVGAPDGGLWIGTSDRGVIALDASLAERAGVRAAAPGEPAREDALASDDVTALAIDASGQLWIGMRRSGLARRASDGTLRAFRHDDAVPGSLAHDGVTSLYLDPGGVLWVGTALGLDRYDPARDEFVHHQAVPGNRFSLLSNDILCVMRDSIGTLWVGTGSRGLARNVAPDAQFTIYHANASEPAGLSPSGIWSLLEDSKGVLWAGTFDDGLNVLARGADEFAKYRNDPERSDSLSDNDVRALLESDPAHLWVGTRHGLNLFDRRTRTFKRYHHDPAQPHSLGHDFVRALLRDQAGTIWVGTYGGGLDRYRPEIDGFDHYRHDPARNDTLSDDRVYGLLQDRKGPIWIGTHGGGLNRLDPATGAVRRYRYRAGARDSLASDRVLSLLQDRRGNVWIGTAAGLNRYDSLRDRFDRIDGLPNDVVYALAEDDAGDLWMSTNAGLVRLDPVTRAVRHYPLGDRLRNTEFNGGSVYAAASRRIYFGGVDGIVVVTPELADAERSAAVPVITDLLSFNQSVAIRSLDPQSPLTAPIERLDSIVLTNRHKMFGFAFATLHSADPTRNAFAYRLDGLDDRWIETGPRNRTATFTNVPPGQYVFRVRTTNAEGKWMPREARIAIEVLPPPWRTGWAYLGYALAAAALLGLALRSRVRRERQRIAAQRAIADSQERLSLALWGSGDEMLDWDLESGTLMRVVADASSENRVERNVRRIDDLLEFVHPEDYPGVRAALEAHLSGETRHFEASYRVRSRSGNWYWRLVRGMVVARDANGRPVRLSGTQTDISRIKAVESALLELTNELESRVQGRTSELQERQGELERANEQLKSAIDELRVTQGELIEAEKMASLGRLVAGVAHEVNTPLGVGVTALSFLRTQLARVRTALGTSHDASQTDALVAPLEHASAMAETNLQRAANLVKSFKQVAVDQSTSTIRTVHLREYLEGTLQSLHPMLKQARHQVMVECDPALEITSRPDALYQVVVNLVTNSVVHAYAPGATGTIRIAATREDGFVRLCYRDDGAGMEPAVARRIFEPFFTTRRESGGSGLGLHIVYNLVSQALAGRITCTTAPGEGARFDVVFPAVHPLAAVPHTTDTARG